ncbi:MAG: hypothetical protein HYZ79_03010 [Candidatus Melainabacteria bacterium]|nr:hypothetical protein [Candidatus Melainabacteria bacterium]
MFGIKSISQSVLGSAHKLATVYDKVHAYLTYGVDKRVAYNASFYIDEKNGIVIITPHIKPPSPELEASLNKIRRGYSLSSWAFKRFLQRVMGPRVKGFEIKPTELEKKELW